MWKKIKWWVVSVVGGLVAILYGVNKLQRKRNRLKVEENILRAAETQARINQVNSNNMHDAARHRDLRSKAVYLADKARVDVEKIEGRLDKRQRRIDALVKKMGLD